MSNSYLLMYKNNKFLYIDFVSCNFTELLFLTDFLVESLRFFIYSTMLSANNDRFTSSFPFCMPFIYFSCLNCLARISNTMLYKRCKSGHPCLVADLRGNAYSFSPLNIMLAMGLSYMAFVMLRYFPSIPTLLRVFIINGH